MGAPLALGEALVLGLVSGPACVASCGPVIVPSLLAEQSGLRVNSSYMALFLATRLCGYMLFATAAWELGALVPLRSPTRMLLVGLVHLLLGCALLVYAYSVGHPCAHSCACAPLVTIGTPVKYRVPGAAVLGLLTGVSLCPPFVTAGIRAAETPNLAAALVFFVVFFAGTSIWFVPFAGLGWIRRSEAVITVARMTLVLMAVYYSYAGLMALIGRRAYGN